MAWWWRAKTWRHRAGFRGASGTRTAFAAWRMPVLFRHACRELLFGNGWHEPWRLARSHHLSHHRRQRLHSTVAASGACAKSRVALTPLYRGRRRRRGTWWRVLRSTIGMFITRNHDMAQTCVWWRHLCRACAISPRSSARRGCITTYESAMAAFLHSGVMLVAQTWHRR